MVADADGKAFAAAREFLEIKRRMLMIVAPEPVVLHRQPLDGFGQPHVKPPEPPRGFGGYFLSEGQSWS